jgi:hypothetical protein
MLRALLPFLLAACLFAQDIDRPARPEEWGYRPADNSASPTNPPSFSWVPVKGASTYEIEWAPSRGMTRAESATGLKWTVYTHNAPLKPGTWYWRYRAFVNNEPTPWSQVRQFDLSSRAPVFPQPTLAEVRRRIAPDHPRAFLRQQDLPRLRQYANGKGRPAWEKLLASAAEFAARNPTPEPSVKASSRDPETNQYWWSNRVQTLKASYEAETLAFVWLLSGDDKWREPARKYILALAAWDPGGPTNFKLNCEAAKPLVHRLARVYDWGYGLFSPEERERIRRRIVRRATDAWNSGEVRQGAGHLAEPYNSHGNRTWHKLAESAVALMGEAPEADAWLEYALAKFWAAYPVWSDDDGGWHEGLSYWAGYMVKTTWWMHLARASLGIDGFKKPFFAHFADYALYSAPPGSPEIGFGDLAHRPPSPGWAFVHYFIRDVKNPYWAWWAQQWKIRDEPEEPVLGFLWGEMPPVAARPPSMLPKSRLFSGIGVAVMNSSLTDPASNVQVRFKSSPMGRRSHGHDPHNSFTLNAYGEALLVNNVYRDLYGSPFHARWCWETKSQNALLVGGAGQAVHTPGPGGRVIAAEFKDAVDYVAGEAAEPYLGKLKRFIRHVLFVKPSLVVMVDDAEAAAPAQFQWMLHGLSEFSLDEGAQQLRLERPKAGVLVDYISDAPLSLRQWTGYEPGPDMRYLTSVGRAEGIPPQWHVEASTRQPAARVWTVTLMRPYPAGAASPARSKPAIERTPQGLRISLPESGISVELNREGPLFATVRKGQSAWKFAAPAQ